MHIVFIYNNKYVSVLNVYQYFFNKHLFKDFSLLAQSYLQMCGSLWVAQTPCARKEQYKSR